MTSNLVLHPKSRWFNPHGRKAIAVRAIQNQDEVMLLSLLEEYLKVRSRKKKAISPTTVMRYKHALKPFFDYIWQPGQRSSILQADENTFDQFMAHISMPDPAKKNRNIKPNQDRQYYSRNSIDLIVVAVKTFFKALVWVNA